MSETATDAEASGERGAGKGRLKPLLLGLLLAVAGGAAGYFAAGAEFLNRPAQGSGDTGSPAATSAFVDVEPMIVSITRPGGIAQLRLKLTLEVADGRENQVAGMMPRILDVLNSYLRAVETIDIGDAATLVRLRAQMLRRVQIVTGRAMVKDLLIQEFVVN